MKHHKLFSDKSDLYESARPTYPIELYDYLFSISPSNKLVWDCACGSGQAAIGLADRFDHVYASDISKEQIENAKQHQKIEYVVAPSEKCALGNDSCDLITVAQALHWFDYGAFWPEALRVLKPGGIFSAWGYSWPILKEELDTVFKTDILKVVEPYWAQQNKLIWNHYKNVDFPFEELEAPKQVMEIHWNLDEFFNFIHTFSATRRCIDDIGNSFFEQAYAKAKKVWGNPETRKTIAFDFVLYVGKKKI